MYYIKTGIASRTTNAVLLLRAAVVLFVDPFFIPIFFSAQFSVHAPEGSSNSVTVNKNNPACAESLLVYKYRVASSACATDLGAHFGKLSRHSSVTPCMIQNVQLGGQRNHEWGMNENQFWLQCTFPQWHCVRHIQVEQRTLGINTYRLILQRRRACAPRYFIHTCALFLMDKTQLVGEARHKAQR